MSGWVRLFDTSELLPGEMKAGWAGDVPVVVFNHDGTVYALEDRCTHEDFELSAGPFDAAEATVECVLHGAKFDVRDGRALCPPAYAPARKLAAKVEDGAVWILPD